MDLIGTLIDLFLHLDRNLQVLISDYGVWVYAILFLVIFCETGLVIFPFLPGDSLLFVAGTLCGAGLLDPYLLAALLILAAFLGDTVNYWIGSQFGAKALSRQGRFIKRAHIEKTQQFYDKHGPKTIVIARFVPIVRTFAPFVAGIAHMAYRRFMVYNGFGSILWVVSLIGAGVFLGDIPLVKNNLTAVILLVIALSLLPGIIEIARHRAKAKVN